MKPDKNKLPFYLVAGLVILQLVTIVITAVVSRQKGNTGAEDPTSTFPFWLIVMIPILASQKKRQLSEEKKVKIMWMMVGLSLLVWLIMVFFLVKRF